MPTYEYRCESCGAFDVEQRITDPALTQCDKCGGPVQRLISLSSFALRGGGWYSDGYASTSAKKSETGKKADETSCAASSSGSCGSGACAKA